MAGKKDTLGRTSALHVTHGREPRARERERWADSRELT